MSNKRLPSDIVRLFNTPAEDLAKKAKVASDRLTVDVAITSQDMFYRRPTNLSDVAVGFKGPVDSFLRASIIKKSASVTFNFYVKIRDYNMYSTKNWIFATFETLSGPEKVRLDHIHTETVCAVNCEKVFHVGFSVEELLLRSIAKSYAVGHDSGWLLRYTANDGDTVDDFMSANEVAAFMSIVDKELEKQIVANQPQ